MEFSKSECEGKVIRLHLGCGERYIKGYINIDLPSSHHPVMKVEADMYKDIRDLEFPENSVDEIRSHHLLEHFSRPESLKLLVKWIKWLKVGGLLWIETPDFYYSARTYLNSGNIRRKFVFGRHIFGSHEAEWAIHKNFWDKNKFYFILKKLGVEVIKAKYLKSGWIRTSMFYIRLVETFFSEKMQDKLIRLPNITIWGRKRKNVKIDESQIKEILEISLVRGERKKLLERWIEIYNSF